MFIRSDGHITTRSSVVSVSRITRYLGDRPSSILLSGVRDWAADRITVGWAVRKLWPAPPIRLGPTSCFVIRHPRFVWYARDPYLLRDSSLDPRRQWGQLRQAYRFATRDAAENCLMWQEIDGTVEEMSLL